MMNKLEVNGSYRGSFEVTMTLEKEDNKTRVYDAVQGITDLYSIDLDEFVEKGITLKVWEKSDEGQLDFIESDEDWIVWDQLVEGIELEEDITFKEDSA